MLVSLFSMSLSKLRQVIYLGGQCSEKLFSELILGKLCKVKKTSQIAYFVGCIPMILLTLLALELIAQAALSFQGELRKLAYYFMDGDTSLQITSYEILDDVSRSH